VARLISLDGWGGSLSGSLSSLSLIKFADSLIRKDIVSLSIRLTKRSATVRSSDLELETWRSSNKSVRVCVQLTHMREYMYES